MTSYCLQISVISSSRMVIVWLLSIEKAKNKNIYSLSVLNFREKRAEEKVGMEVFASNSKT